LEDDDEPTKMPEGKHKRALSEHKLLRSLPKLKISGKSRRGSQAVDQMSSSQLLPPKEPDVDAGETSPDETQAKRKSKMMPGQDIQVEKRRPSSRRSRQGSTVGIAKSKGAVTLAKRLQQIFEFEEEEDVISGMPCLCCGR
jgi:sterol 3beta-glucosyltransferase